MNRETKENKQAKWFERPPKFKMRLFLTIVGVLVQGFGLSWLIRLNLGTDPFSNFVLGWDKHLPGSFGTTQLCVNIIMVLYVLKFKINMIGYGTVANMVFLGYIADFFGWIWDSFLPAGFFDSQWVCLILLVPVFAIFIVGAATYMSAGLGASPYDGIPFILSEQLHKSFRATRMVWDITFMVIAFILGGGIGVVTFAVAFFAGPVISAVQKQVEKLLK